MVERKVAGRPPPIPDGYTMTLASHGHPLFASMQRLEYEVFLGAGYVDDNDTDRVLEYDPWLEMSKLLAVLDDNEEVVGVVRVRLGPYAALPLAKIERRVFGLADPVCEYASLAISPHARSTGVAEELYRAVSKAQVPVTRPDLAAWMFGATSRHGPV